MKKIAIFAAAAYVFTVVGSLNDAQAHSAKQCIKELQTYASGCKLSPTAWILGFCKNKKAQKWCTDKKKHDKKFH